MRNYFSYSIVLIGFFFIGCKTEVGVSVTNNSGVIIDSVLVSIRGQEQRFKTPVQVGKEGEFDIDFSDPPKGDGLLMFVFYLQNGSTKEYSQYLGGPRGQYNFEVCVDTVKVDHGIHLW